MPRLSASSSAARLPAADSSPATRCRELLQPLGLERGRRRRGRLELGSRRGHRLFETTRLRGPGGGGGLRGLFERAEVHHAGLFDLAELDLGDLVDPRDFASSSPTRALSTVSKLSTLRKSCSSAEACSAMNCSSSVRARAAASSICWAPLRRRRRGRGLAPRWQSRRPLRSPSPARRPRPRRPPPGAGPRSRSTVRSSCRRSSRRTAPPWPVPRGPAAAGGLARPAVARGRGLGGDDLLGRRGLVVGRMGQLDTRRFVPPASVSPVVPVALGRGLGRRLGRRSLAPLLGGVGRRAHGRREPVAPYSRPSAHAVGCPGNSIAGTSTSGCSCAAGSSAGRGRLASSSRRGRLRLGPLDVVAGLRAGRGNEPLPRTLRERRRGIDRVSHTGSAPPKTLDSIARTSPRRRLRPPLRDLRSRFGRPSSACALRLAAARVGPPAILEPCDPLSACSSATRSAAARSASSARARERFERGSHVRSPTVGPLDPAPRAPRPESWRRASCSSIHPASSCSSANCDSASRSNSARAAAAVPSSMRDWVELVVVATCSRTWAWVEVVAAAACSRARACAALALATVCSRARACAAPASSKARICAFPICSSSWIRAETSSCEAPPGDVGHAVAGSPRSLGAGTTPYRRPPPPGLARPPARRAGGAS